MKVHRFTRIVGRLVLPILYLILSLFRIKPKNQEMNKLTSEVEHELTKSTQKISGKRKFVADRLIIIDDDPGMFIDGIWKYGHYVLPWLKLTDPDGGLELIYALRDPNVQVIGITTMMGVATTPIAIRAAKRILKLLGRSDVPVLQGAITPANLGHETEAAHFLVDAIMENPGQVEIIATGPLTNIATALMIEPRLPEFWGSLHFATGEFLGALGERSDLFLPTLVGIPDLNTNVDVPATKYVVEHAGPFPIYPNEVMDDVFFTRIDYETVKNAGTKLGDFLAYELKIYNFLYGAIPLSQGMVPHGVPPTALTTEPSLDCYTVECAVELRDFGKLGHAFVLSNDPKLPKHKIFVRLSDKTSAHIHDQLLSRCI